MNFLLNNESKTTSKIVVGEFSVSTENGLTEPRRHRAWWDHKAWGSTGMFQERTVGRGMSQGPRTSNGLWRDEFAGLRLSAVIAHKTSLCWSGGRTDAITHRDTKLERPGFDSQHHKPMPSCQSSTWYSPIAS